LIDDRSLLPIGVPRFGALGSTFRRDRIVHRCEVVHILESVMDGLFSGHHPGWTGKGPV
jgi:hypothetical protein